ncbi:MAG TPA: hypothetical protein PK760_10950, partial [Flavobacteriales bacterium]|nr:hypothetical protein [Flavobacteriales bacterium]
TTVTFCLTVNSWNTTNANWLHGIVPNFGAGWDQSTLVANPPAPCGTGGGTWGWYNSVQGTATTALGPQGPGYFYDLDNDGNPGNNFGDFCTGPWTFCWTITTVTGAACVNGIDCSLLINTFGDSETGGWSSSGCTTDPIVAGAPAVIQSCAADAGIGGPMSVCTTSPITDLFAQLTGTPDVGGTWTAPGNVPHSGSLDPAFDVSGDYTYTVGTLIPPCNASSVVTVSISSQPSAGNDGTLALCTSSAQTPLFNSLGGTPDAGGSWSGPGGASTGTVDPAIDAPGVYTYTVTATAPCVNASANITLSINPSPNAGADGALAVCSDGALVTLFNSLNGSPSAGGTWTDPNGVVSNGDFTPGTSTPGAYTYIVIGVSPCPMSTAVVSVTQNNAPNAGTNSAAAICDNIGPTSLVALLGGTPDAGGTWMDANAQPVADPIDPSAYASGTFTYMAPGIAPCANAQAALTLTISQQPSAGGAGALVLCEGAAPVDLFTAMGGAPSPGGTWTDPNGVITSNIFDPATDIAGDYTYTVAATPPCSD